MQVKQADSARDRDNADELFSVIDNNEGLYTEKMRIFDRYKEIQSRKPGWKPLPNSRSIADLVQMAAGHMRERTSKAARLLAGKDIVEEYTGWLQSQQSALTDVTPANVIAHRVKFHNATYMLAVPASPDGLSAFVTASLRADPKEDSLARIRRLVTAIKLLEAQPPIPQVEKDKAAAIQKIKTVVVGELGKFFEAVQKSSKLVDDIMKKVFQSAMDKFKKELTSYPAADQLNNAAAALKEAATVFPGAKDLLPKLGELAKMWKYWQEGSFDDYAHLKEDRESIKRKLNDEILRPISQFLEAKKQAL